MADDEGRGNVLDLPLVRLFAPPEARPPEDLTTVPADGFPTLPAAPAAVPPESLSLPSAIVPAGDDDSPVGTMLSRAADPGAGRARNAAAPAMVVASAIAVACLRGCFGVVEYVRARAEHHRAVRSKGRPDATRGDAGGSPGRIPSGPEFGRGAVRNRRPKSGTGAPLGSLGLGTGGGGGGGRKGRQNGADASKGHRNGPGGASGADSLKGLRRRAKKDAAGRERERRRTDKQTGPGSEPGSPAAAADTKSRKRKLKKADGRDGESRTTLSKVVQERADRRLKKRRKNPQPAIGKDKTPKRRKGKESEDRAPEPPKVDLMKRKARRTHTPGGGPGPRPWQGREQAKTGPKKKHNRRKGRHTRADRPWEEHARDMPGPDGEWLKPPPGWTVTTSYTVEQDGPTVRHPWPEEPVPAAMTAGRRGLPRAPETGAAPRPGTTRPIPVPAATPARSARGGPVTAPVVRTTQYTDSDLTIHDVIDADADMAEEILAGADQARAVAEKCEAMTVRLEALYAKVQELKVPGLLAGMVLRLMEKAETVKGRAEAVAATLPRASEAIAQAGANAERRHKPLSDITRDMGHAAPAERDYHKE